ncbi:hypothetical protein E1B28_007121 [Marasmius oreades]|uniref:Uncharacterized protein n=1 Tax=Marasmius oreades TaxID=181124 RepID=A0A9P7S1L0_9AGAR|nr:uncharacterized protein E1B28_007121 [Marasmius oreades]KAG7093443.1 hypothetical protein E1B28_007121 [Marasmius oreades]
MALDDAGMHRAGLGFVYRITPVLVVTILYGIYIALLCFATRGLWLRGLKNRANLLILLILYVLFFITSALWALEVAQLVGLVELFLDPKDLSTDGQFNVFYALVAKETKITSVLFECQMIVGDILVIWRLSAIWFNRRILVSIPVFWWVLMIINMIVCAAHCGSGVSSTNYSRLCKVTQTLAPVLSIVMNISVMVLTVWKAWLMRDAFVLALSAKKKNKLFSVFVLLIESGTLYVIMLIADLLVTSLVVGGPESVGRMIICISGYSTVQFVAIYPTLMIVILRESIWNSENEDLDQVMSVSEAQFCGRLGSLESGSGGIRVSVKPVNRDGKTVRSLPPMEFAARKTSQATSEMSGFCEEDRKARLTK